MAVLYARIGGAWVPVGGGSAASEVEVAATDPIGTNPNAELWYDTTTPAATYLASQVAFTPVGTIAASDVQSAIAEVASEAVQGNVPWIALQSLLVNGWTGYGAPYGPAYYRKVGDVVSLRGLIQSGTATAIICTLPVGYRPQYEAIIGAVCYAGASTAMVEVRISTAGTVTPQTPSAGGGPSTWLSLTGITFSTT